MKKLVKVPKVEVDEKRKGWERKRVRQYEEIADVLQRLIDQLES